MATHCQTAARSGSGERQNIGAVNSFQGKKKGGGGSQLQTTNQIRVVTCKMCLFVLYFVNYMIFMSSNALWKDFSQLCVQFCIEKV